MEQPTEQPTKPVEKLVIDSIQDAPQHNAPALPDVAPMKRGRAVAAPSEGPMSDAIAFLRAGGTTAELRDMLALQREWKADQAKQAFVQAMADFKKNPPEILKDKRVYFESTKPGSTATDYWHATLGNVNQAIVDGLAEVGISHSWRPERKGDRIHVTCILRHKEGHEESVELDGPLDASGNKNNIQQAASTITYLQRYTLLLITGIAVKDEAMPDTDGRGAFRDPPDPAAGIDPDLVQRARDASMEGWAKFRTFVAKLKEEERVSLEPLSESLKAAAKNADQAPK